MKQKKYLFYAIGNALLDIIIKTDDKTLKDFGLKKGTMKIICLNELKMLETFIQSNQQKSFIPAGSAGNSCKIASLLNQAIIFFGTVGSDKNGQIYRSGMENYGIKAVLKQDKTLPTGICLSLVTDDGERTMLTYLGSAGDLDFNLFSLQDLKDTSFLYIEGYQLTHAKGINIIKSIINECKNHDIRIALDLSDPFVAINQKEIILSIIEHIDILFANEQEAYSFSGINEENQAAKYLYSMVKVPVIKLGSKGSMAIYKDRIINVPAHKVKPLDTTGAGDSFAAGFLAGMAKGLDIKDCLNIGNLTAREMVKIHGTEMKKEQLSYIINKYGL